VVRGKGEGEGVKKEGREKTTSNATSHANVSSTTRNTQRRVQGKAINNGGERSRREAV